MAAPKLKVDLRLLSHLLRRIRREDLIAQTKREISGGRVSLRWRNSLICLLVRYGNISRAEIGSCFEELSQERIRQITEKNGVVIAPKETLRRKSQRRLRWLATQRGRSYTARVMKRVAAEGQCWSATGPLKKTEVLLCLGFSPTKDDHLIAELWRSLMDARITKEELRAGIVLRYGLGVDPVPFIKRHYRVKEAGVKDVLAIINEKAEARGLLPLSEGSLKHYMRTKGISIKKRGSKNPFWLRR